jgi:hypothetical protein
VGTWAAADWAVRFYRRNGFELVSSELKATLLETYWRVPERQIETSVVLANPPLEEGGQPPMYDISTRSGSGVAAERSSE